MLTLLRRLLSVGTDAATEENFFISSGLEFYGDLVARASSGRIEGKFDGHIIECKKLIIGPHATIKGNVFAEEIVVYGYCEGNLYAAGDLKVFDTAVILGDIHASSLIVEHNATFRGNLRKLRTEDFLEITSREKEKIIQQRKSNVYNIHSLNARREAEQSRARKVANGMPLTQETEVRIHAPLKRIQKAAPIALPNNRLMPSAVSTGSDMPRAINIQASPVDVRTLTAGTSDFLVPTMDEAFLPDYVVPLPLVSNHDAAEAQLQELPALANGYTTAADAEPSASLLLLEAEAPEAVAGINEISASLVEPMEEVSVAEPLSDIIFEQLADLEETMAMDAEPSVTETEAAISFGETAEDKTEEVAFFMDVDDAEAMVEAQIEADQSWMEMADLDAVITENADAPVDVEISEVEDLISAAEVKELIEAEWSVEADEEITTPDALDAEVTEKQDNIFSFPTSISTSFEPFQVDQNDNGIRIDPSVPFIRIPDAAPRIEETPVTVDHQPTEIRATFIDSSIEGASYFGTLEEVEDLPVPSPAEVLLVKSTSGRTMIPRQLSSPDAFELLEASGTMIIIRETNEDVADEETNVDRRQQGGPELRGSEPLENDEPKFKISSVPTAEPGYEPGYTNQQRITRKPLTEQPENTRHWF
jgi:cytoskeletal protein CcmA (bactofilin family)